jgi:hypothetical protein
VQAVTLPAGAIWCEFVSGKPVVAWSKLAVNQETVLWQVEHVATGNTAAAAECFGFVVCFHVVRWHPAFPQSVAASCKLKLLPTWQFKQGTFACPFVSGKLMGGAEWFTVAPSQLSNE